MTCVLVASPFDAVYRQLEMDILVELEQHIWEVDLAGKFMILFDEHYHTFNDWREWYQ